MKLCPLIAIAYLALAGCATNPTAIPDRIAVLPDTSEVLLENECVRVQYHDVAVGQTIPMHSHPHYVVYPLVAYKARATSGDGSQRIREYKAGDVHWNEATSHSIENLGDTPIRNLVIELKPKSSCR